MDNISIEQQAKEDGNFISHPSYQLPPPVTTLTISQRPQAISFAPNGVSQQSDNIPSHVSTSTSSPFTQVPQKQRTNPSPTPQPLPPFITYHRRERPPIPSQTLNPPNSSASAQNQPHMASFSPPPASPIQPNPPTQPQPNHLATKVHPMTTSHKLIVLNLINFSQPLHCLQKSPPLISKPS